MSRRKLGTLWIATALAVLPALPGAASPARAQQPQVVRSTGPGAWGARLRLVEEVRIGALDGRPEVVLGSVDGVAAAADGTIYVADGQVPVVRAYDASGRFLRNIGAEGEGPGEYRRIMGMRVLPDGGVAVWDGRNARITVFEPSGSVRGTHPVASGFFSADIFQVDRAGRFYVRTITNFDETTRSLSRARQGWIQVSPTGRVLDTIPIPLDERPESFVISTPSGFDRPFTPEVVSAMSSAGYLITGRNDAYAIELHRSGAPPLRIERAHTPLRLTREERGEWLAFAAYMERRAANPTSTDPRAILPAPRQVRYPIPEVKPAFSELRTDSEGRIWVRRYVPAQRFAERDPGIEGRPRRTLREPPTYDVFEADGRFLGTVALPIDARFQDARGRQVLATLRGRFDESYVVRFRIEAAP